MKYLFVSLVLLTSYHITFAAIPTTQCNLVEATPVGVNCVCNDNTLMYNYLWHNCSSKEEIYGNNFCGMNALATGDGPCECVTGWKMNNEANTCSDVDDKVCDSNPCKNFNYATCVPTPNFGDNYVCSCQENYMLIAPGQCTDVNEAVNPRLNDCPQLASNVVGSEKYKCKCYDDNYYDDVDNDGLDCTLKSQYSEDSNDDTKVCITDNGNPEIVVCFAKQGYVLDTDGKTAIDIDECADQSAQCWSNSMCMNLENGAGYDCVCNAGYTDAMFDQSDLIRGCYLKDCPYGLDTENSLTCPESPCANVSTDTLVCSPTGPYTYATYVSDARTVMTVDANRLTTTLTVTNGPVSEITLNEALFTLLEEGATQLQSKDGVNFDVSIVTSGLRTSILTKSEMNKILSDGCMPTSLPEDGTHCLLPSGVEVLSGFKLECPSGCASGAVDCADENLKCIDEECGRYKCTCIEYGTGEYMNGYMEKCSTMSELNSTMSELEKVQKSEKHFKDSTIALGVCFGLSMLAVIGGVVYVFVLKK